MSIRSLVNLIVKVLGLFIIKDFLMLVPHLLSVFMYLSKPGSLYEIIYTLLSTLITAAVYFLLAYFMIFKTDSIIDKLNLTSGIKEDSVAFNMHWSTIIYITIMVLAGYVIINELPFFCRMLYIFFMERRITYDIRSDNMYYLIASGVKVLLGFLLLGNMRLIVKAIERSAKKEPLDYPKTSL